MTIIKATSTLSLLACLNWPSTEFAFAKDRAQLCVGALAGAMTNCSPVLTASGLLLSLHIISTFSLTLQLLHGTQCWLLELLTQRFTCSNLRCGAVVSPRGSFTSYLSDMSTSAMSAACHPSFPSISEPLATAWPAATTAVRWTCLMGCNFANSPLNIVPALLFLLAVGCCPDPSAWLSAASCTKGASTPTLAKSWPWLLPIPSALVMGVPDCSKEEVGIVNPLALVSRDCASALGMLSCNEGGSSPDKPSHRLVFYTYQSIAVHAWQHQREGPQSRRYMSNADQSKDSSTGLEWLHIRLSQGIAAGCKPATAVWCHESCSAVGPVAAVLQSVQGCKYLCWPEVPCCVDSDAVAPLRGAQRRQRLMRLHVGCGRSACWCEAWLLAVTPAPSV